MLITIKTDPEHVLIRSALAHVDPTTLKWRAHGMGLVQAYLSPDIRIHVWHKAFMDVDRKDQFTHQHRWDLVSSRILAGTIRHVEYEPIENPKGDWCIWRHGDSQGGGYTPQLQPGRFNRVRIGEESISEGQKYAFPVGAFHETWAEDYAVTLIQRGKQDGVSCALIPKAAGAPKHGVEMNIRVDTQIILTAWEALS